MSSISVVTKLNMMVALLLLGMLSIMGFGLNELQEGRAATAEARTAFIGVCAATILVFLLLGIYVRLQIRMAMLRPIRAASHLVGRVAAGDLTATVGVVAHGETQKLLEAIETMIFDLGALVGEVTVRAHTVADTSLQIAHGNLDLSQRTEEQASTLEETASSLEQLTSTVTQNAHSARQASQLAIGASEVARKGGEVVGQVVATMTGISDASKKIADIIGVIDGIAFQTNILALNAAVEAARAGEQGRGFAVVATEVRSLAQRSAAAAKEIKALISDSVERVDAGSRLVGDAGHTMEEIVGSVKQVSDLIAEIAAASHEQSAGIAQVNTAVTQMEHVVQQNASLVEEATAATESMKEQADSLLQMVSRFKLVEAPVEAREAPRPAAGARAFAPAPRIVATVKPRESVQPAARLNPPRPAPAGEWREF